MNWIKKHNLVLAWIVAIVAMSGSLYFSEVRKFIPCSFCWYQRILMYPQVLLLGIAVFKKDRNIITYVLPMTMIGAFIGTIHYLEQKTEFISNILGHTCQSFVPCNGEYVNYFGFVTIPFLSLTAFILITILLSVNKKGE